MKKIIALLFFVLLYHVGFAQVWQQLDGIASGRNRGASFSIGDTGYIVAGGASFQYLDSADKYNAATNTWSPIAYYPSGQDDGPVGFVINGVGYVGTGVAGGYNFSNLFYTYTPATNTWTIVTVTFPGAVRAFGVAFVINGKAYVGGGYNGSNNNPLNDFYCYDPVANSWSPIAPCPAAGVSFMASAFAINGVGYVGGGAQQESPGSTNFVPQSDFWKYIPDSNKWYQVASFGGGVRAGASAWASCDKGYVGTGYTDVNQSVFTTDFWQYDPSDGPLGKWTQLPNFKGAARAFAYPFAIGNTGYVCAGWSGTYYQDLWELAQVSTPAFTTANSTTSTVCAGGSITFKDTSNYSPTNWFWQFPGGTPDTSSADSVTVVYDSVGHYNVILSAWNSCDSGSVTDSNYVTVGARGILSIVPPHDTICSGQSVSLVVTNDTGATFTWKPFAGLSDSTGNSVVANPTITTIYSVTGTGSAGCAFNGIDTITVNSPTPLIVLPQPGPLFCSGLSAELNVQGGGSKFIWTPTTGLSDTTSGDSVLAAPLVTTTYYVTGNDSLGCASSGYEVVTVIASPNKPTFYQHGDTLTSSATTDNQWYMDGAPLNGDTSQNLIIYNTSPDSFYVVVENEANGCSTSSDTTFTTGINQLSLISNQLSIYPNPFNNDIFITISSSAQDIKDWNLQIIDVLGRTVYSRQSLNYSNEIDLSNLPGGVYFITVINKTGRAVVPVVKQ